MKITIEQMLRMNRKIMRETNHTVKPMKTTDKKKQANKRVCRKKVEW